MHGAELGRSGGGNCPGGPREPGVRRRAGCGSAPGGFLDTRFDRHAGVSSVVYGEALNGMGGADENGPVKDLVAFFAVHTPVEFDYLNGD